MEGIQKLRVSSLLLDGVGVVCEDNGLAIFDRLHSKANDESVLELNGEDCRRVPLGRAQVEASACLRARHTAALRIADGTF